MKNLLVIIILFSFGFTDSQLEPNKTLYLNNSFFSKSKKILFVVSNAHFYGNSKIPTGNSFSEIVIAYNDFIKNDFKVEFVSPNGGAISLSYINTSNPLEKKYLYNTDFMNKLKYTKKSNNINDIEFSAIYFPGGGAAMFGVSENKYIQKIAMGIYNNGGVIGAVCHGTAGIVNLKLENGDYLVKGKRVNGYPDEHENINADYFKEFPFLIKKTIVQRGGFFKSSPINKPHLEVDNNLITGQNPISTKLVAEAIIKTLNQIK